MFVVLFIFVFVGPLFVGWGETEVDYSGGEVNIQRTDVTFVGPDGEEYTIVQVNLSQTQINRLAGVFSHGVNAEGETVLHILGTDSNGMDVFARLMYGGRVSLTISFMAVILNTLLGIVMGGLAGYAHHAYRRRHKLRPHPAHHAHIQRHLGRIRQDVRMDV